MAILFAGQAKRGLNCEAKDFENFHKFSKIEEICQKDEGGQTFGAKVRSKLANADLKYLGTSRRISDLKITDFDPDGLVHLWHGKPTKIVEQGSKFQEHLLHI